MPTTAAAFPLVAFFFCWVFEAGLGDVELPLPAELEPEPNPVHEARWRVAVAFAEANCLNLRNGTWQAAKILLDLAKPPLFWTPGVNLFLKMLWAKSRYVADELGSEVRSR